MGRGGVDGWSCKYCYVTGDAAQTVRKFLAQNTKCSEDEDEISFFESKILELNVLLQSEGVIHLNFYLPGTLLEVFPDFPDDVLHLVDDFDLEEYVNRDGSFVYVSDITDSVVETCLRIEKSVEVLSNAICNRSQVNFDQAMEWFVSLSKLNGFLHGFTGTKNQMVIQMVDMA